MRRKRLSLCLIALELMTFLAVPAFAELLASGDVTVGDGYAVTTISGEANAWVFVSSGRRVN